MHDLLEALPLFGQALAASRIARRGVIAMLDGTDQRAAVAACDAIDGCACLADGWKGNLPTFERVREVRPTRFNCAALESLRWAVDSCGAAQGSLDFPVDSTVTASARRAVAAICEDRRVSAVQVGILLGSDIDLIGFACREAHIGKYDGLTAYVFDRLPPVHALTLTEPRRKPEDEAR